MTGVAGSGKSSLIGGSVSGRDAVVTVDQAPIRGSRRSNPATYTGLLDPIRNAFAKANGVKPALFSANSDGACPGCNGAGVIYKDLAMMAGVATVCEECGGKRFDASVLEYRLGGRDISEVLAMSAAEAREFFSAGSGDAGCRPRTRSSTGSSTSGSGTSRSDSRSRRCPGASASGSSSSPTSPREAASTSSTNRRAPPSRGRRAAARPARPARRLRQVGDRDRASPGGHGARRLDHRPRPRRRPHDGGRVVFEGTPADLVAGRAGIPSLTGEHLADYVRA